MMGFFKLLSFRGWLLVISVSLMIGVIGRGAYAVYQWNALKKEVVVKDVKIQTQAAVIKADVVIASVKEAVQVSVQAEVKKATVVHAKIQNKVKTDLQEIEQYFEVREDSVENLELKAQQRSTALINGLWQAYCAAKPAASTCVVTTP